MVASGCTHLKRFRENGGEKRPHHPSGKRRIFFSGGSCHHLSARIHWQKSLITGSRIAYIPSFFFGYVYMSVFFPSFFEWDAISHSRHWSLFTRRLEFSKILNRRYASSKECVFLFLAPSVAPWLIVIFEPGPKFDFFKERSWIFLQRNNLKTPTNLFLLGFDP